MVWEGLRQAVSRHPFVFLSRYCSKLYKSIDIDSAVFAGSFQKKLKKCFHSAGLHASPLGLDGMPCLAKTLLVPRPSIALFKDNAMVDRPSILVVDDELGPRESLRMILKTSYQVHTVEDGAAALAFLEKNSVDLITLDLKMPTLSGIEVLEKIRDFDPDVMVIIVTGYGTFKSVVDAIRFNVFDYISKPFGVPEILSVVKRCFEMDKTRRALNNLFTQIACLSGVEPLHLDNIEVTEGMRNFLCRSGKVELVAKNLDFLEIIRLVSRCIERRDPYPADHSERVSRYTDILAEHVGLSVGVRDELRLAAYLHDLGKVCISSRFMNSEGRLSSTDWAILKRHPIKSVELARPLNLGPEVISAIRYHHERYDGTGYPEGIAGMEIPLGARILSIGNVYDFLTSRRPYRKAMGIHEAKAEIRKCGGSYFDPDLTRKFVDLVEGQQILFQNEGADSSAGGRTP